MATLKANRPVVINPKGTTMPETNATSAPPPAGHNAEPWQVELDQAREHLDPQALVAATSDYERIASGASGFAATTALASQVGLTPDLFAAWTQNDPANEIERFIREVHNLSGSKDRQIITDELSAAIYAAVCASSPEVAKTAKEGDRDHADPNMRAKINAVRSQVYGTGDGQIATREAAVNLIDRRLTETKDDPELNAIWRDAKAAKDQVLQIRKLAARLNAASVNATRWRLALFMPLVKDQLEAYADAYGNDKMATIQAKALGAARNEHKDYRKNAVSKGIAPNAEEMVAAIQAKVAEEVIDPLTVVGGTVRSDEEVMRDVNKRLWRLLKQVDDLWSTHATEHMRSWFRDIGRDKPSENFAVGLAPEAKATTTGAQAQREGAEDTARSHVAAQSTAAKGEQTKLSAAKQKEREEKAAAANAATTQTAEPAAATAPRTTLQRLKQKNQPAA